MKRIFAVLIFALVNVLFSVSAKDFVNLKNGSVVKGELIELSDGHLKIESADGSLWVFELSEVEHFGKDTAEQDNTESIKVAIAEKPLCYSTKGFRKQLEQNLDLGIFFLMFGYDAILGYQINSRLFFGVGTGFRRGAWTKSKYMMPLYIDARFNCSKRKVTPFFGMKAGRLLYLNEDGSSCYYSPSFGVKIHFVKARALSISLGLTRAEYYSLCDEYCCEDYEFEEGQRQRYHSSEIWSFNVRLNYQF